MGRKQEWSAWALPHILDKMDHTQEQLTELWEMAVLEGKVEPEVAEETMKVMHRSWESVNTAELFWADKKFCHVVAQTSGTVPQWSPAAARPSIKGFLAWEKPITHVPMPGHIRGETPDVSIDAVAWMDDPRRPDHVNLAFFSRLGRHQEYLDPVRRELNTPLHEMLNISLHKEAPQGAGADAVDVQVFNEKVQVVVEAGADRVVLSVVGATWLLMQQPRLVVPTPLGQPQRRRDAGARPQVRVTTYDVARQPGAEKSGRRSSSGGREYSAQWWVRGHWRQQAYGPGWSLRRPIFIDPHLSGPADKPVDDRPRVRRYTNSND